MNFSEIPDDAWENPNRLTMALKVIFDKAYLNKKDIQEMLDISSSTLNRAIRDKADIPNFTHIRGQVKFPIFDVAEFLVKTQKQSFKTDY